MIELVAMVILGVFVLFTVVISIPHILQLQISEYLFYKYKGVIRESGYLKSLIPLRFNLPSKSPRNILVGLFLLFFQIGVAACLFILFSFNTLLLLATLPVLWLTGKLAVFLGVLLTAPLAYLVRLRRILIATRQLKRSKVQIIGITGSYGKSSVKEILYRLLSVKHLTGKTRGNYNTEVGIALEIGLQVTPVSEYFIAEMGAYRVGDIRRICNRYSPKFAVLTAVGNQHLAMFGSRENIMKAKSEIFDGMAHGGRGYLSADIDGYEDILAATNRKIITYGFNKDADARITDVSVGDGTTFTLRVDGKSETYETKLLGKHNVSNITPAILIARELGLKRAEIAEALAGIDPLLGKLSIHSGPNDSMLINDSYNSNVAGFLSAIATLKDMPQKEKIISTHGVLELGLEKQASYSEILQALEGTEIRIITTDKLFASLSLHDKVSVYENEEDMLARLRELLRSESVALIEGRHSPSFMKSLGVKRAY